MSSDVCLEHTYGWCTQYGVGLCCNNWSADDPDKADGQNYDSEEDAVQQDNEITKLLKTAGAAGGDTF